MQTENNKINSNQQPQQEEKKKKNKFVAWWLGLGKWAKVGICAGTAAVLATSITLGVVFGTKNNSQKLTSISLDPNTDIFVVELGMEDSRNIITNPSNINLEGATTTFEYAHTDTFQFRCDLNSKKLFAKALKIPPSGEPGVDDELKFSVTLSGKTVSTTIKISNHE